MGNPSPEGQDPSPEERHYRLCPRCGRAVLANSPERYCIHDGTWLLCGCPLCGVPITSPDTRFCAGCGLELVDLQHRDWP